MRAATPLIFLALTACVSPERKAPYTAKDVPMAEAGGFECDATSVQYAIGKKTSVALAQDLMAKAGATVLRWIPPRTIVTADLQPSRLNIVYDDNYLINEVICG
jgi:Peptidase inhibitor I78 family